MILFLLALLLFQDPHVLVLKNGKRMVCESYEASEGKVHLKVKGKAFSLPASMIDFEASRRATQAYRDKLNADRLEQEAITTARQEKKPRKVVKLTNEDYQKMRPVDLDQTTSITYEDLSNNIIINVHVNKKGPYRVVLDTGASISILSPEIMEEVAAEKTDDIIKLSGLAGKIVVAPIYNVQEFEINTVLITNHTFAATKVSTLEDSDCSGLIGQDILKNFVMKIDAANRIIEFTPNKPEKKPEALLSIDTIMDTKKEIKGDIDYAMEVINRNYQVLMSKRDWSLSESSQYANEMRDLNTRLQSLDGKVARYYGDLTIYRGQTLNQKSVEQVDVFLACRGDVSRFTQDLKRFSKNMSLIRPHEKDEEAFKVTKKTLQSMVKALNQSASEASACF